MEALAEQKQREADTQVLSRMEQVLAKQKQAFLEDGPVSLQTRQDRIDRVISLLVDHQNNLCEAMREDFGHRSMHQSRMADIMGTLESLKFARKNMGKWMQAEKRKTMFPLGLLGARARVEYHPKGVVGNLATWNFPTHIALGPLAGIFAAGNRCMVKLSEVTPETSQLLERLMGEYFEETELAGINGGPEVGAAFSALPFDHMLFTGATGIARHILHAAADNLTPVTLELGGKSPVIICDSYDVQEAAVRIMSGKAMNVGQVCLSPDYVFVKKDQLESFVQHCAEQVKTMFPTVRDNPDYSSVVNHRHYQRLQSYLQDAREKGADIRVLGADEDFNGQAVNRMPMTAVIDPGDDLTIMQEEIFGPVICIKSYQDVDECIRYIRSRPHPLALYLFSNDEQEQRYVLDRTISGGVCLNDVMMHVSAEDLPFGGIGASGMGNYHGREGFKTFSHARAVFKQSRFNLVKLGGMLPPYGEKCEKQLDWIIKK